MSVKFLGFDIETDGKQDAWALQPWRVSQDAGRITSYAAVDEAGAIIGRNLNPTREELTEQLKLYAAEGYTIVGSNIAFDISWLMAYGLEQEAWACKWADLKFYWKAAQNVPDTSTAGRKNWGLKAAVTEFLPALAGYEKEISFEPGYEVTHELLVYNTIDSGASAMLARRFYDALDTRSRIYVAVMNGNIPHFAQAYHEGLCIGDAIDAWEKWAEEKKAAAIETTTLTAKVLNSPSQLKEVLKEWGYGELIKKVVKGVTKESTDKDTLSRLLLDNEDERIKAIADYKTGAGNISRYITPARKSLAYCESGRVHCQPSLWGTYTGRVTYSSKQKKKYPVGIALAQIPRPSPRQSYNPRKVLVPPAGYMLAEYDFSNQESRIIADRAAEYSSNTTLLDIFNKGLDYHSVMGANLAGWEYEKFIEELHNGNPVVKFNRMLGKVANLQLSYRSGWETFQTVARAQYEMILDDALAKRIVATYKTTYPAVTMYWRASIETAKVRGYAETIAGRRLYLSDWGGRGGYATQQSAINFPIQGSGADMKYLAVTAISPILRANGVIYGWDLHDALFLYLPIDENTPGYTMPPLELAVLIKEKLNALPYKEVYGWIPKIPMPVDGKLGTSWGDLEEI